MRRPTPRSSPPPARRQRHPRLSREYYLAIAERAKHESLRGPAVAYGVSHETIRKVADQAWRLLAAR